MNLKPFAVVFCGLLVLSALACRDDFRKVVARNEEDQALWLQNVVAAEVQIPESGKKAAPKLSLILERAASVPGVEQAAVADFLPGASVWWHQIQIEPEGAPHMTGGVTSHHVVSPGYFTTMELGLLQGRYFTQDDDASGPLVAIVNESYAEQRGDPDGVKIQSVLGKRVRIGWQLGPWLTIVGVVQDGPRIWNIPEMYVPYAQHDMPIDWPLPPGAAPWYLLVRVPGDREAVVARLQQIQGLEFRSMEDRLKDYMMAHEPGQRRWGRWQKAPWLP